VTSLTGLRAFEWVLVCLFGLGVVLVVQARTRTFAGARLFGFLAVPALAGLLLCVLVPAWYGHEACRIVEGIGDRAAAVATAGLALATAVAFADLLLGRLSPIAAGALARLRLRWRAGDAALLIGVALPVVAALASLPTVDRHFPADAAAAAQTAGVREALTLPGHPMDLAVRSPSSGYASFGEGSIVEFDPTAAAEGRLRTREVASGLRYPRGIAISGDTLFAVELGELPCKVDFPTCKGPSLPELDVIAAERLILRRSRARVLAFHINDDGTLGNRRTVIDDIPFANTDHGVNDIEAWDGRLYLSIGNVDLLYADDVSTELPAARARLLGTVLSFAPDGGDVRIHASGLRNVYGLAFDDRGRLYGSDNDGATRTSWRREEVDLIERGADFGYPLDGTFAPYAVPRQQPLWVLDTVGTGGIAWVHRDGEQPTLYVGSAGRLDALKLTDDEHGGVGVADRTDVARILDVPGYVTAVKRLGDNLVLGVFTYHDEPNLYILDIVQT
jgi:glucose/sorbosone dehydrogenase